MIKKRYLLIISVTLVSIIFGSLLYNSIAQAGKPEPTLQKDAVEIDVLEWVTRQWESGSASGREWGIYVREGWSADFSFVFSPKQSIFNVTNAVIVVYATGNIQNFVLSINNVDFTVGDVQFPSDLPSTKLVQLDTNLLQINEGINLLTLSGSGLSFLSVYKISLFIEYEYQA